MLSKNNLKYLHTKLEPRKQRFTIKKFNVGVASVLIGTTFALFAGQQQVSADDITTNQVATTPNPTTSGTTENDTSQPTTTSSQTTPQLTYGTDGKVSAVPKIDDSNAKGAGTLSEDGLSITTKDGQKLILSSNTIGGGSNNTESSKTGISLTYSGSGKQNDKVIIIIPKGTPYKIGGFPTDPNNKHTVSNVDSADGLYNVQTATYTSDDSDSYSATEYFTPIKETSIGDVPNLATDVGNTEKFIQFYFNDVYQGSLKVNQLMTPTLSPVLTRLFPGTNNDVKVKPNTLLLYALNVNEDPNYVANQNTTVPQIIKNINYGTTITIPVPTGFKLDLEKTNAYNTRYKGQYDKKNNFTITQQNPGDDIIITVPKDNGAETSGSNPYVIAGSYVQNVSQETSLKTDKQITIIQKINDNGEPIKGSTNSFSNTLVPEDTNLTPAGSVEVIADGYKGWFTPEYSNFAFKSGQTESDHMAIGYYGFKTTLNTPITNATITLQFTELGKDSGKAYSEIDQVKVPNPSDTLPNLNGYTYQVTYTDGTTNQGSIKSGDTFIAESGKYIKSISFTPNELSLSYTDNYNLLNNNQPGMNDVATKNMFVAYGKFKNVDDTGTNQTVTSQISVTIPNLNGSDKQVVNTAVIEQQVTSRAALKLNTYGQNLTNTDKTIPSNKQNNVYVVLSKDDSKYVTKEYEPIFYYVLPKGSYYAGVNADRMPGYNTETTRPKITTTMVDGQQVVKIDYTGTKYIFENSQVAQAWIYAKTYPDAPNYTDVTGSIYINPGKMVNDDRTISNRLVKLDGKSLATTPFIPDDNNIYKIQDFTWRYEASGGKSVQTLATGNTAGEDSVVSAHSDTKGSTDMTYYFSTMNYVSPQQAAADIKDTYIILNLPQESATSFQFTLKDPKTLNGEEPVKYVGSDNSLQFTYKYSEQTQPLDSWKAITGIPAGLTDSYVTADQVKDWSKIKSVMVSIPLIKKNIPVGRFKISGQDLTLAQDAGKTGSIEGEGFAAAFQPFTPGTPATITVTGQATLHARYHYVDANGTDQYLDLPDKVYQENKDTLKTTDFINAANQAKIPAGYELVGTTGTPTWTNGGTTWQADGTNDTAAFDQVAKYYMDGDTVTFELQHKIKEVTVTDNIKPNTPIAENPSVNYPTGIDNLQKQPTFTVNVTVDGNRDDTLSKVQPLTFTRSAFVDEVTGKLVDTPEHPNGYSAWIPKDGTTWNQVDLPVKQGYFRTMTLPNDVTKVSPTIILAENYDKITADHPDTTVNVAYTKLGYIQPVDENGNPLSAALTGYDTPQYENDANDPEKAILPALPQINGYTAYLNDQPVSATNAYSLPQDLSQNLNVTYKKDDQHLKIQVLDVNDDVNGAGVPIALTQDILTIIKATADMIGKSGDAVDKDELQANLTKIKDYFEDQGYKLYAQSPVIDTFDFDTKQDQSVTLKLIHDTEAQIQTKDITRTINYLDESGKTIQSTQTDKLTLVRYQVKDKVNHDVLGYTQDPSNKDNNGVIEAPFSEANANDAYVSQAFSGVTTPDLKSKGYDLDRIKHDGTTVDEIPETTVNGNSTDMTYDVIYTPHIITVTKDTNVQPGQPIDNTGYVYPQTSQFDANQLQGVATREINFSYENNTQAEPTITQVINFERQGTLNLVTGDFTPDTSWSIKDAKQDSTVISTNNFAEVSIPTIAGYTPKINGQASNTVEESNPTQPQDKEVVNVVYVANSQVINYTVIDDTANKTVVNDEKLLDGVTDQEITPENKTSYQDVLDNLVKKGYKVISNDNLPDKFGSTKTTLKIHVVHDTEVSEENKQITCTINYLDESGKTIQPAQTDTKTLVRYQVKDKVNGKVLGYTQDPNQKDNNGVIEAPFSEANANDAYVSQVFDAQSTPDLKSKGYDLDRIEHDGTTVDEIPKTTVDGNSTDMTYDVIYTPHIIPVTKDTNVQPGQPIDNTGYVYPENSKFDASQLQGIAKRVINFKYEDQTQASTPIQQVITFERQGTLNLVTGEFIPDSNWTVSNATQDNVEISTKDFAEVSAPEILGYTPSQATVAKEILTQPQADSVDNITYTANPQRAEIQFIDDTTKNDLVTISENGTSDGIIATTNTKAKLAEYLAAGYELVSDNFNDSTKKYDRDDNQVQQYAVHLKHKTVTVNPGDNKKTSDKLPDNSNLNYPDSVTEDNLHAQSKRTINFESTDNKLTIQPVIQTINYRRTATIDEVTGDVTYAKWDAEGQNQWPSYQVPVKEGYFANVAAVNQVDNVEANQNETVPVTYKPLGHVVAVNEKGEALPVSPVQYKNNSSDATQMAITYAPEIPGYTVKPNAQIQKDATGKNLVTPTDLAQDTEVTYIANPQVINYTVIDDTTGQISVQDVKLLDGVTDREITSENQTSYEDVLDNLAKQGYKVISNDDLPGKFGSTKTTLKIHVVHDTEVSEQPKLITRTINLKDTAGKTIQPAQTDTKTLVRYKVKDKVNGKVLGYTQDPTQKDNNGVIEAPFSEANANDAYVSQVFDAQSTPDLKSKGYDLDRIEHDGTKVDEIPETTVNGNSTDMTYDVIYTPHIITVTKDTNVQLGQPIDNTGYVYPQTSQFDANQLQGVATREINFSYEDNTQAKPTVTQVINFERQGTLNLVTGDFTPDTSWNIKDATQDNTVISTNNFAEVSIPTIAGYTPKINGQVSNTVEESNPTQPQAKEEVVNVVYVANPQVINYTVIDDTANKTVVNDEKLLDGVTDQVITTAEQTSYKDVLDNLAKKGYKVISNDNLPDKFGSTKTTLEIHVVHDTELTPETKTVTRTIEFIDKQSNDPISKVQSVKQAVTLQRYQVKDKVTNTLLGYATKDDVLDSNGVKTFTQSVADGDKAYVVKGTPTEFENYSVPDLTKLGYESGMDENDKPLTKISNKAVDGTTTDETIKVYYNQHVITVDYDTPKTGNVGSTNYVYPTNSKFDASELTRTDTRTINYVYGPTNKPTGDTEVKQTIEYHQTARLNLVTGDFTPNDDWKVYKVFADKMELPNATEFAAVCSPTHDGYTPDQATVESSKKPGDITVTYKPDYQEVQIKFIDTDNNKEIIKTVAFNGHTDEKMNYDAAQVIDELSKQGYVVVNDGYASATDKVFDNTNNSGQEDAMPQTFTISMKHKLIEVSSTEGKTNKDNLPDNPTRAYPSGVTNEDLNKTITRTISIDGKVVSNQPVTLTRTATVDEVTGEITQMTDWKNSSSVNNWPEYTVTPKAGYTPIATDGQGNEIPMIDGKISAQDVDGNTASQKIEIRYVPQRQELTLEAIDDQDPNNPISILQIDDLDLQGLSDQKLDSIKVQARIDEIKQALAKKGYVFDTQDSIPTAFDNDSSKAQVIKIHFKHLQVDVTSVPSQEQNIPTTNVKYPKVEALNEKVSRTITSKYANNKQGEPFADVIQTIEFQRKATIDAVTKNVSYTDWQPKEFDGKFSSYVVPTIAGYTPNKTSIPESTALKNGQPQNSANIEVIYTPNNHDLVINYVDAITKQLIKQTKVTGKTDQVVVPNYENPVPTKYVLDDMNLAKQVTFSGDENPTITVPLIHQNKIDTIEVPVTRLITVVKPDGTKVDASQTVTVKKTTVTDLVTNKIVNESSTNAVLARYVVPTIAGYTPTMSEVAELPVQNGMQVDPVEISYTANPQATNIIYQDDDNDGKVIVQSPLNGKTDQQVALEIGNPDVSKYLVVNDYPTTYTFKADNNAPVIVHLKHKTQELQETKTITRKVILQVPGKPDEVKLDQVTLTRSLVKDLVTGETKPSSDWTNGKFAEFDVPKIKGMTANIQSIEGQNVNAFTPDSEVTVAYTPVYAPIRYTIVDSKTHQVIKTVELANSALYQAMPKAIADEYQSVLAQLSKEGYTVSDFDTLPQVMENGEVTLNISVSTPASSEGKISNYNLAEGSAKTPVESLVSQQDIQSKTETKPEVSLEKVHAIHEGKGEIVLPQTGDNEQTLGQIMGILAICLGLMMGLNLENKKKKN